MEEKLWNKNYIKVWSGNFLIHFAFMLIVPLLPVYLSTTFGATKDEIGFAMAGYAAVALLVRPLSGYIVDSFPRKVVLCISIFFFSAFFVGYLVAGSLVMFALFRTLHGLPFGATAVSISTAAVDVLPSSKRTEGIGYYGLSNNFATVLGPVAAIGVLHLFHDEFRALLWFSFAVSVLAVALVATIDIPFKVPVQNKKVISLDRFFLLESWREAINIACFAFAYGIISTYVAIYGKERLGMDDGAGLFFTLLALGLALSRLTGIKNLREGKISLNALEGIIVSMIGYALFAAIPTSWGYYGAAFVIGLGNGHFYPAFQNMFINLGTNYQRGTANSSLQTSWDAGLGLGILLGGVLSEHFGYGCAFWAAAFMELVGLIYFIAQTRSHYETKKLR